jgi:hypothetical protein
MVQQRVAAEHPVAILSFHSHSDRSFLDDRELALLSGVLRDAGIANDLVLAVITREMERDDGESEVERRLVEALAGYDPIVYERVWSPGLVERLRGKLPGKLFVGLRGEHVLLDAAPADVFCDGEAQRVLPPLIRWLRGESAAPPQGILLRAEGEPGGPPRWLAPDDAVAAPAGSVRHAPNLRPVVVNPEALPPARTFSVTGNGGCPFQLDARQNALYAGIHIPDGIGRGCAFCTTGNHYEGRPNAETAASVFEQIRYVRANAPELTRLVLKDQNPFSYLTEVIERCEAEQLTGFTLLLETRAEWMLRNAARFERALAVALRIGVRIAPFLVGIENFSQAELDRFNKGTTVAANIEFIDALWAWKARHGEALDLDHTAFGFILFTPWTTIDDLEANLSAIRRTRFDRLRGSVLLSRVRLYPDTALYYLAERDGLLADQFESEDHDASRRYGYYPSRPWRHLHADVAHFAALATRLAERNGSRDMVNLFQALLDEYRAAPADWMAKTDEDLWRRYRQAEDGRHGSGAPPMTAASDAFRQRFARLVRPLSFAADFAGGWRFGPVQTRPGRVEIELRHAVEAPLLVEIVPRGAGPHFRRSRHYDIRAARQCTAAQREALAALSAAIADNDR